MLEYQESYLGINTIYPAVQPFLKRVVFVLEFLFKTLSSSIIFQLSCFTAILTGLQSSFYNMSAIQPDAEQYKYCKEVFLFLRWSKSKLVC